jgi:hypothetical protein
MNLFVIVWQSPGIDLDKTLAAIRYGSRPYPQLDPLTVRGSGGAQHRWSAAWIHHSPQAAAPRQYVSASATAHARFGWEQQPQNNSGKRLLLSPPTSVFWKHCIFG